MTLHRSVSGSRQADVAHRLVSLLTLLVIVVSLLLPTHTAKADAVLGITPITWNIIGLDSNYVSVGPANYPVGVRVCNTGDMPASSVTAEFLWDSADDYIDLRAGSTGAYSGPTATPRLEPGQCADYYFEISIVRSPLAYGHNRRYHITADTAPVSTPQPRELYLEHLVSQNRNAVTDVRLDGGPGCDHHFGGG